MSKCSFQSDWLVNPKFKWLKEVTDNKHMAYCTVCKAKFNLSNMGLRAVTSHQKGKKHNLKESSINRSIKDMFSNRKICADSAEEIVTQNEVSGFTQPTYELPNISNVASSSNAASSSNVMSSSNAASSSNVISSSNATSSGIKKYLLKEDISKAEIRWCLEAVINHRSLRSAEKDVKAFPQMFTDSEIAKGMRLGRDKIAYTLLYGIAPYFKEILLKDLVACNHFVIGFDESLNKVSQRQQLDLNVRYWCNKMQEVKTRFLSSAFLGRSCATDLLDAFRNETQPLQLKKLLQISMDGPNVNKKFFRELSGSIKENHDDPEILNIGSCGLHAVNIAFKTGAKCTGWNIIEFNRALYYLFKDSPARRSLYTFYTNSTQFPLKFCSVRWLENADVTARSLNIIPHLKSFIDKIEKDKVAPSCQSYKLVKEALKDNLISAKLAFFNSIAVEMETFLREYQTDNPLIPFLYEDLTNMLLRLMGRFVKKDLLKRSAVLEIDLEDERNILPNRHIDVGISVLCHLKKIKLTEAQLASFRSECKKFLAKCVNKLQERSPLIYELTIAVSCFSPCVALNISLFEKRLTKLLLILCEKNWLGSVAADKVKNQLKALCVQPQTICKLKQYKRSQRIDQFWFTLLSSADRPCNDAIEVMKMVMILSHGNSNVERGFSINKDCLWDNMKEESIVARRIIYDTIQTTGGLADFCISKQMLLNVKNSRAKFEEEKMKKHEQEKEKVQYLKMKKETDMQLKELQAKKSKILDEAHKETLKIDEEIETLRVLKNKL